MVAITVAVLAALRFLPILIRAGTINVREGNKLIKELKVTKEELARKKSTTRRTKRSSGKASKRLKSGLKKTCRFAKKLASGKLRFVKKSVATSKSGN